MILAGISSISSLKHDTRWFLYSLILACSARKTLKINRNHPHIEGFEPGKYTKEQTNSQHTKNSRLIVYPSRISLVFIRYVI